MYLAVHLEINLNQVSAFHKSTEKTRMLDKFQARPKHMFLNHLHNFGIKQIAGRNAQTTIMSRDQNRKKISFSVFTCESFLKFISLFLKEMFERNI